MFKPYLKPQKGEYKGGISKDQVVSDYPVYKLSSNENLLGSSPMAIAALKEEIDFLYEYPDPTDKDFKQALSEFYGGELAPNQFVTGNSGVSLLQLITHAFLGEGLECVYSFPGFSPYKMFPMKEGAKAINVPLLAPDFSLDVEGILGAINEDTRLVWLCSPNNPTGSYIPKAKLERIIDNLPDHVALVYDEVYFQYTDAEDYARGYPYVQAGKNVIAVNSFSKAYGLAGLRIGYAYTTPQIAEYLSQLKRPFTINSLSYSAAMAALKDVDHIKHTVESNYKEKHFLYEQLDKLPIRYWKTQANFILVDPGMDPTEFQDKMHTQGIMVRPTGGFGSPSTVRVTIGHREANEAYIRGLKAVLGK